MSQPMVHSFHVIFSTTKFHFNRDMDSALNFTVMKTELYAIILTIFIYITHVHLFVFSPRLYTPQGKGLLLDYILCKSRKLQQCHLVDILIFVNIR